MNVRSVLRLGLWVAASLAGAWGVFVTLYYVLTLDDQIVTRHLERATLAGVCVYTLVQLLVTPVILLLGLLSLRNSVRLTAGFGILLGFLCGLWLNATALSLPYIGIYPNILGAFIGTLLSGQTNAGPAYWLSIIVTNLTLFPILGWLFLRRISPRESVQAGEDHGISLRL